MSESVPLSLNESDPNFHVRSTWNSEISSVVPSPIAKQQQCIISSTVVFNVVSSFLYTPFLMSRFWFFLEPLLSVILVKSDGEVNEKSARTLCDTY